MGSDACVAPDRCVWCARCPYSLEKSTIRPAPSAICERQSCHADPCLRTHLVQRRLEIKCLEVPLDGLAVCTRDGAPSLLPLLDAAEVAMVAPGWMRIALRRRQRLPHVAVPRPVVGRVGEDMQGATVRVHGGGCSCGRVGR